jgi:hypothetical protein
MQKEEGLVSGYWASPDRWNDNADRLNIRLSWAMGYGYTEDPNNIKYEYRGFYNQVNLAAWQLYWNARRATLGYSDYQVGQTMNFDGQDVHFDNASTAALYRYTPHIQYGFHNIYYEFFGNLTGDIQDLNADIHWEKPVGSLAPLKPGETWQAKVEYRNAGSVTWKRDEVRLGTKDPLDRRSIFNGGNGWTSNDKNRISMNESEVSTGNLATFEFEFKAPDTRPAHTTNYLECFKPVKDSGDKSGWFHNDDQVCWSIPVAGMDDTYHYSYVSQSPSFADDNATYQIMPGETKSFSLTLKNTGESTWTKDTVRLGTSRPNDRIPFYTRASGWRSDGDQNRILMQEDSVAPGSEAHFNFDVSVPADSSGGTFREYYRLVADGIGWMEDYGIYWNIKIPTYAERYSCEWQSQNRADNPSGDPVTLYRGQKYNFTVTFRNNGITTWTQDVVKLGTSRDRDRVSAFIGYQESLYGWLSHNRIRMEQNSVAPGELATFSFELKVPDNMPTGEYKEYFQMVAEHMTWMQDYGVYWRIRIP